MDFTVDSMLITTPRRRPRDGVVPTPMISSCPVALNSPMMAQTFVVPMSSPTIELLGCHRLYPSFILYTTSPPLKSSS